MSCVDKPMYIIGTQQKTSWTNLGEMTDLTALQNQVIYMFMIAIRLGGGNYIPNALNFTKPINGHLIMRNYFTQFS